MIEGFFPKATRKIINWPVQLVLPIFALLNLIPSFIQLGFIPTGEEVLSGFLWIGDV